VEITVLGESPSWQDAGGACSGYLIENDGFVLLLDCGNGVFSKLRRFADYLEVDAVLISHLHADHFLDLIPFAVRFCEMPHYTLTYAVDLVDGASRFTYSADCRANDELVGFARRSAGRAGGRGRRLLHLMSPVGWVHQRPAR
jgi:ribonuclease BN (tRNA processing enzyme)